LSERTWEAWFLYELANSIYAEVDQNEQVNGFMDKTQRKELAVRLAEICTASLKEKAGKRRPPSLTVSDLRQQMTAMELQPYDDDLLSVTVAVVNLDLQLPPLQDVIYKKLWNQPTLMDF